MHQSIAPGAGLLYQRMEEIRCISDLLGGVTVIRLQPQRLEERAVPEGGLGLLPALVTSAVDGPQEPPELLDVVVLQPAPEQHRLPVLVGLGHSLHREKAIVAVLEDERRD